MEPRYQKNDCVRIKRALHGDRHLYGCKKLPSRCKGSVIQPAAYGRPDMVYVKIYGRDEPELFHPNELKKLKE